VTSSLAVFEAGIWVKSRHPIKSCLKTRKKETKKDRKIWRDRPVFRKEKCLDVDSSSKRLYHTTTVCTTATHAYQVALNTMKLQHHSKKSSSSS